MEFINIDDYCLGLVGYLYKCYENNDPILEYPSTPLPLPLDYRSPRLDRDELLKAQCMVNRTLREYFFPVFEVVYQDCCRNVGFFQDFLREADFHTFIGKHSVEHSTQMKLLGRNALVTELVLYCFKQECYALSNIIPENIKDFLELEEFKDIFTTVTVREIAAANLTESFSNAGILTRERFEEAKRLPSPGYTKLQEYCLEIVNPPRRHPDLASFRDIGTKFKNEQMAKFLNRSRPINKPAARKQGEPAARKQGEPAATKQGGSCLACDKPNCSIHLDEFIKKCEQELIEHESFCRLF